MQFGHMSSIVMDACNKSSKSRQNLFTDILELFLDFVVCIFLTVVLCMYCFSLCLFPVCGRRGTFELYPFPVSDFITFSLLL